MDSMSSGDCLRDTMGRLISMPRLQNSNHSDSKGQLQSKGSNGRIVYPKEFLLLCFRDPACKRKPRDLANNLEITLNSPRIVGHNPYLYVPVGRGNFNHNAQQYRDYQHRDNHYRDQQHRDQYHREEQHRGEQHREQQHREQQHREQQHREQQLREQQTLEEQHREVQHREGQHREGQYREGQYREQQQREKQYREQQQREQEQREQHRELQQREEQQREQQHREKRAFEKIVAELVLKGVRQNNDREEAEPLWYSEPASRNDKVVLGGFPLGFGMFGGPQYFPNDQPVQKKVTSGQDNKNTSDDNQRAFEKIMNELVQKGLSKLKLDQK